MVTAAPNMTDGFPASAVDLGRLQETAEHALRHFTEERLARRWDEVFDWVRRFLARWVQRRKALQIKRHGAAIHVELTTQDDLGYYKYAFDIFPERGGGSRQGRGHSRSTQTSPVVDHHFERLVRSLVRWRMVFLLLAVFERQARRLDALGEHGALATATVTKVSREDTVFYTYDVSGTPYVERRTQRRSCHSRFPREPLPPESPRTRDHVSERRTVASSFCHHALLRPLGLGQV